MPVFIPEPVQKVLDCIAEMNIRTTTKHKITSITEIYTQQWKPQNLQTLVAFLRANIPGIPFVTDEELILHINETGKEVLKKHKESEAFRNRYGNQLVTVLERVGSDVFRTVLNDNRDDL